MKNTEDNKKNNKIILCGEESFSAFQYPPALGNVPRNQNLQVDPHLILGKGFFKVSRSVLDLLTLKTSRLGQFGYRRLGQFAQTWRFGFTTKSKNTVMGSLENLSLNCPTRKEEMR